MCLRCLRPLTEPVAAVRPEDDRALRADVRRVAALLGESLVRQQGRELLDLVERVRTLTKQSKEATGERRGRATRCGRCSPSCRSTPRRCWCARSPLLPSGQRRRAGAPGAQPARPAGRATAGWPARSRPSRPRSGAGRAERGDRRARRAAGVHRPPDRGEPPVGPDQAARGRPTSWPCATAPDSAARGRGRTATLAEIIDLIWQTDELRQHRPTPVDEARNALYYLQDLAGETLPGARRPTWPHELARHGAAARRATPAR